MLKLLFLGDIVGRPGRNFVRERLPEIKTKFDVDVVIANGENAAGGVGIDVATAQELFLAGINIITTGNHVWNRKEVYPFLDQNQHRIVRPLNYPKGAPGAGYLSWTLPNGKEIAVVNLMGRIFTDEYIDCPFQAVKDLLASNAIKAKVILVDIHAEATSEKLALLHFLDGKVTAVIGTHTHVQTADEYIFPGGTAYISDAGMCGPANGIIGVDAESVISRFCSGLPVKFDIAKGPRTINGIVIECDETSGKATTIERIYQRET